MDKLKNTSTFNKLIFLIVIFLIGFISLFSLNQVFTNIINKLDRQTENLKAQITIGEFIAHDIVKTRSLFNELVTTTSSKKSRELIKKDITITINLIKKSLNILEKGGTLKRKIALNIAGHLDTIKTISYQKDYNKSFSVEVIDISPKLNTLLNMINEVEIMLQKRQKDQKNNDVKGYQSSIKEIRRYYKTLPAFFNRMTENIRRLLYESGQELSELEQKINKDKNRYLQLKIGLILIIISIVLILGYTIAKNINKSNKQLKSLNDELFKNINKLDKQKKSIRAILDTQPNIVIVSDGEHIQDSNRRLFEFLHEFSTLDEFKREYACICNKFENNIANEKEYIQNKNYGNLKWFEYILNHPEINFKAIILNSDNQAHHFSIKVSKTLLDEVSNESVVIISLNDITKEIENQIQLKELNENLENLVDEKTRELSELNENLEQRVIIESQKVLQKDKLMMQQAKLASMGEMIGNIAHQWRQPLSVITSSASGMQMQAEMGLEITNKEIEELSHLVVQQAQYLSHTIDHFSDFIKGNTKFGPISVRETIDNTLSLVDATLKSNHIKLIKTLEHDLTITGNMNELTEAFINVINNSKDALKSTIENDEERYIFVSTHKIKDNTIEIQIKDNGGGISEDIIDRIFEPYFTSKHQSVGTGLGLAMVDKIIIKRHNGTINVNNVTISYNKKIYPGTCMSIRFKTKEEDTLL